jgi:hypothetical protein
MTDPCVGQHGQWRQLDSSACELRPGAAQRGRQQPVDDVPPPNDVSTEDIRRNTDADWEYFNPDVYFKQNYAELRDDDRQILRITAEHFAQHLPVDASTERRAIDVGTGVNLYPAMAMLPFSGSITLYEYAPPNVQWLEHQRRQAWAGSWKSRAPEFWNVLKGLPHDAIEAPLQRLSGLIEIRPGNIYDLPCDEPWDLGTMFFVAESITEDPDQFHHGIDRFLNALRVGAPFVFAFMEHRLNGYHVAGQSFPSTDIGEEDVRKLLNGRTNLDFVKHIDVDNTPLEDPYSGMLVACGRTSASVSRNGA